MTFNEMNKVQGTSLTYTHPFFFFELLLLQRWLNNMLPEPTTPNCGSNTTGGSTSCTSRRDMLVICTEITAVAGHVRHVMLRSSLPENIISTKGKGPDFDYGHKLHFKVPMPTMLFCRYTRLIRSRFPLASTASLSVVGDKFG